MINNNENKKRRRDSLGNSCLRGNRDDFAVFHLRNLLLVDPCNFVATGSFYPFVPDKNKTPMRAFDFCGGDEGIRTLDTVTGIPHFQCGALDQLCDVSEFMIILRFLIHLGYHHQHPRHHHLCLQPKNFPILHQYRATLDLR